MDAALLRAFVAVAESGGFSAAARRLSRTQSAVSLQIRRLEEQLGQSLFERTSRSVRLTEAGEKLLPYARRMLRLQEEAQEVVGHAGRSSLLRFGITEEQALAYLPGVLSSFTREHPRVRLEIVCDMSTGLLSLLQEGLLDMALTVRHRPSRTGTVIAREPLIWAAADGFRLDDSRPVPLAVNPEGCLFRARALAALGGVDREWRVVYTSQSPTGINLAVQAGIAVTVKTPRSLPEGCRIPGEAEGLPELPPVDIELHRAPGPLPAAAETFGSRLVDAIAAAETVDLLDRVTTP